MQLWGLPPVHPQTLAMADEIAHTAVMLTRFFGTVYGIMLKTTVDELLFAVTYVE